MSTKSPSENFFQLEELGLAQADAANRATMSFRMPPRGLLEINDFATLTELRPVWQQLHERTPHPTFCQSLEWLQLYLRQFGPEQRLRAFCSEDNGETVGLTVLVERQIEGRTQLMLPNVGSETVQPLGARPWANWESVGKHLKAVLPARTTLDLRGLLDPKGQTTLALQASGLKLRPQPWTGTALLPLSGSWDALWSGVSPALRDSIQKAEQRLAARGRTHFVRFRPNNDEFSAAQFPSQLYDQCLTVTLNDELQLPRNDSLLNDPARHQFLRDLMPWAWRHNAADLSLLLLDARPIAFRFHTVAFGHLQTVWSATDADFADLPLAAWLLSRIVRDSVQRGDRDIDLGPTTPEAARDWNAALIPLRRFTVSPTAQTAAVRQPHPELCAV